MTAMGVLADKGLLCACASKNPTQLTAVLPY